MLSICYLEFLLILLSKRFNNGESFFKAKLGWEYSCLDKYDGCKDYCLNKSQGFEEFCLNIICESFFRTIEFFNVDIFERLILFVPNYS